MSLHDLKGVLCCACGVGACGGDDDDNGLMQLWFQLVQQKNILVRYESELLVLYVRPAACPSARRGGFDL